MQCQIEPFAKVWWIPTKYLLKTSNKIPEQWNAGQSDLKYYEVIHGVRLTNYAKFDVNPMKSVGDIRQN